MSLGLDHRAEGPPAVGVLTTGFPRFAGDLFGAFVLELCRALTEAGERVVVVAPHGPGLPTHEVDGAVEVCRFRYFPGHLERMAYGSGIPTNLRCSWGARLQVPFFLLGYWWWALRLARRCCLLHCHWTISGLVGYLATRLRRCPLVLSVRGSDVHLLGGRLGSWLNRCICQRMDAVLAVSQDIADRLVASGVDRGRIHVVPNGVDARFCPGDRLAARRSLGLPEGAFLALFVGLLVPVKGVDLLVDAFRRGLPEDARCVLVGDGSLELQLRHMANERGIGERIVFAGRRPSGEIPAWMQAADVLVLPSLSEGRPNVVLEAQSCGIPVIATRVGGTPELISEGETGILIEPGDVEMLGHAIQRLAADPALRERMGIAARRRVESSGLTWAATAAKVREVYRQILVSDE
ncbi:glycosyltransferase [Candidatus Latescibacterota bacterium]